MRRTPIWSFELVTVCLLIPRERLGNLLGKTATWQQHTENARTRYTAGFGGSGTLMEMPESRVEFGAIDFFTELFRKRQLKTTGP